MSNNCLVTKLKGSVQNDNLPRFNQSLLDYNGRADDNYSNATNLMIMVDAHASNSVKVITATDMHEGAPDGTLKREFNIEPGAFLSIQASKAELGNNPIINLFKIDNGIYDLCKLSLPIGTKYDLVKTSIKSILKNGKIYAFCLPLYVDEHDFPTGISSDTVEYLNLTCNLTGDTEFSLNLSDLSNFPSTKVIYITSASPSYSPMVKSIPEDLEYIANVRFDNDIENLPASLKGINSTVFNTGKCKGTIESFIDKARLNGRTSGYLIMQENAYASATKVTLNGNSLANIITSTPPTAVTIGQHNYYVLTWDASTISWGDTAPADAIDIVNMSTVYRYNKQS